MSQQTAYDRAGSLRPRQELKNASYAARTAKVQVAAKRLIVRVEYCAAEKHAIALFLRSMGQKPFETICIPNRSQGVWSSKF
jgi:hypothetical protein